MPGHGSIETAQPFVFEQMRALKRRGMDVELFLVKMGGLRGYLQGLSELRAATGIRKYDLIHAHYGLCGILAILQKKTPVIITFHGSDVHYLINRILSSLACLFSLWNIFVSGTLYAEIFVKPKRYAIIPCGVDLRVFYPVQKKEARDGLGLDPDKKYILFASRFDNKIKNFPLAARSAGYLSDAVLLELKDRSRSEVNLLLNAVDVLLMTSYEEGSPQIIKEAMACNCPIVSTDVGDVRNIVGGTDGCYIASCDPKDIAEKLKKAIAIPGRTRGRERITYLDNDEIAKKVSAVYDMSIKEKKDAG